MGRGGHVEGAPLTEKGAAARPPPLGFIAATAQMVSTLRTNEALKEKKGFPFAEPRLMGYNTVKLTSKPAVVG